MSREFHPWLLVPAVAIVAPAYAADYLSAEEARLLLFPQADSFVENTVELDEEQRKQIKKVSGVRQRWETQKIWRAEKDGKLLGWFIVDEVVGKHEYITYGAGINADGSVVGIEVMSYRETHGDEVREQPWRDNFTGKTLASPLKLDEDIPNISGATLSCRNITDGVKRLLALHDLVLRHG